MRGKDIKIIKKLCSIGITPAYAGKSFQQCTTDRKEGDHPRVCGEKNRCRDSEVFRFGITPAYAGKRKLHEPFCIGKLGSPPRMRGKVDAGFLFRLNLGITPAYAGKSLSLHTGKSCHRDHPRVCGEKKRLNLSTNCKTGSPPRMRGKVQVTACLNIGARITPAYAGKRASNSYNVRNVKDHPRVCGEKCFAGRLPLQSEGITPAYAGKRNLSPTQRTEA